MAGAQRLPLVGFAHRMEQLAHDVHALVESGLCGAANTIRAYAGDWARFTAWCQLNLLPAPVKALAGFLTELAEAGKKVATI